MSTAYKYQPHYTVADYQLWKGDWELWHGTPVAMSPAPFEPHEYAVSELAYQVQHSIKQQKCSCFVYTGLDWIVQEDTVVRPDVMVVCGKRPTESLKHSPTLAIEVLSKSTMEKDRIAKRDLYERHGVKHYLIVDTKRKSICWLAMNKAGQYEDFTHQIAANGLFEVLLHKNCVIQFNRQLVFGAG